jgi:hypothetical protein
VAEPVEDVAVSEAEPAEDVAMAEAERLSLPKTSHAYPTPVADVEPADPGPAMLQMVCSLLVVDEYKAEPHGGARHGGRFVYKNELMIKYMEEQVDEDGPSLLVIMRTGAIEHGPSWR